LLLLLLLFNLKPSIIMKKIKILGVVSLFAITFLAFACEKEAFLPENQNLSKKIDILNLKTKTTSEYDLVTNKLILNQSKSTNDSFTEIKAANYSYLSENAIRSIKFSLNYQTICCC